MADNAALTEAVYYILLALKEPLHGYAIMKKVAEMSNNRVTLAAGTLYGALSTLLEKGWIALHSKHALKKKKEYIITNKGDEVLLLEIERLKELLQNGERVFGNAQNSL